MPKRKSAGVKKTRDVEMEQLLRDHPGMKELLDDIRGYFRKGRAKQSRGAGVVSLNRILRERVAKVGGGATVRPKGTRWVDPDDAPELTKDYFERADLYHGDKLIRRGRPPSENPKQAIKLRIDADVVEYFRTTGPGWQTRINEALRRAAKLKRPA
jgi:uncharacterized protein (DUF4415 family)